MSYVEEYKAQNGKAYVGCFLWVLAEKEFAQRHIRSCVLRHVRATMYKGRLITLQDHDVTAGGYRVIITGSSKLT